METRSGLNNLRVVNLPEGAEAPDTCSFLEGWIPEALDLGPLRCPIVMERVRRAEERQQYSTENFDNEMSEP
ncbi:Catalase-peroxidase [Dissostichus eleginoides]|nr:Catalase-peroxidase [Dissostichus eleginoides]